MYFAPHSRTRVSFRCKVRAASGHLLRHHLDALGRGVVAPELLVRRQAERRGVVKKRYFRAPFGMILDNPVEGDQKLIAIRRAHEEIVRRFRRIAEHVRVGRRHERHLVFGDAPAESFRVSRT